MHEVYVVSHDRKVKEPMPVNAEKRQNWKAWAAALAALVIAVGLTWHFTSKAYSANSSNAQLSAVRGANNIAAKFQVSGCNVSARATENIDLITGKIDRVTGVIVNAIDIFRSARFSRNVTDDCAVVSTAWKAFVGSSGIDPNYVSSDCCSQRFPMCNSGNTPVYIACEDVTISGNTKTRVTGIEWRACSSTGGLANGILSPELAKLDQLKSLKIYRNSLTGTIPSQIGLLTNLRSLWLNRNGVLATTPDACTSQGRSYSGLVATGGLTGSIPQSFILLQKLEEIVLNVNSLSGNIPLSFASFRNLTTLYLNVNQFSGSIPPFGSNQDKLVTFELPFNRLSGVIPSTISRLKGVQTLLLACNRLTGTLPEMQNFKDLRSFDVSINELEGQIPASL